jgi:hypothetical protein
MKNIIFLTICLLFTGCMTIPKPDLSALKPPGPVTSVVASWEPAMSNGENPMRGFGGRVYFYDQDQTRPVKIDGTVIVYIFDEDGRAPGNSKPDEGHHFDEKTLKGIYSKSKIGHSYNLWVPLDEAGPEQPARKVSLIVRYIPKHGASQVSSQATVYLPGKRDEKFEHFVTKAERQQVQQASALRPSYDRTISSYADTMQTATIR